MTSESAGVPPAVNSDGSPTQSVGDETEYKVQGLSQQAEILVDSWGVPHIYAKSHADMYLAQGFQVARDRLFQIDLWRRRGLGKLAEVLGGDYLAQDRAARQFLYRGDMIHEWTSYSTGTRECVSAFVKGINSYVSWALEDTDTRLPPEFSALSYQPAFWEPEDVVRIRTHGLLHNVEQELVRALNTRDLSAEAEDLRAIREPHNDPTVESRDWAHLDESILDTYRAIHR